MWIKNVLIGALSLVLIIIIALLAFIGVANSGLKAEKLTDDDLCADWLSGIDDATAINDIYIPGTHDSGALYSFLGISGKCQSYEIKDQLDMGIRFLDIRLQLRDNELAVVHSFVDQKQSFESVLKAVRDFLEAHPSEFVIISIKQDADAESSDISFEVAVEQALEAHLREYLSKVGTVPTTLGEARGSAIVLSRYSGASLGISASSGWHDSTSFELGKLYVQDYYAVASAESKLEAVANAFRVANERDYSLVLNFTSCYLENGFPPAHAPTAAKLINPQLLEMLEHGSAAPCVFICDFVSPELIGAIIQNNFKN